MRIRNLLVAMAGMMLASSASADLFLVTTTDGPGFRSPDEVAMVLESGIIPTFDALMALRAKKKVVAGGLPVGSRKLVLIIEAGSHAEVDQMLRDLPAWGVFSWKVTALQSLTGRMEMEKQILKSLKHAK